MKKGILLLIIVVFAWNNAFAGQNNNQVEKISQEQEDIYKAFLQETTVVLKPYQQSMGLSLRYTRDKNQSMLVSRIYREFSLRINYHIGLPKGIEAFLSIPAFVEEKIEQDQFERKESKDSKFSVGDLLFGSKFILFRGNGSALDIIGSLEIGIPIREESHWFTTAGLTMLKSCDPVMVYTGLSYTYLFEKDKIQLGEIIGYNFGMAFMVNDKITLGEQIIGSYQAKTEIESEKILFSESEPMMLRSSLTYAFNKNVFLEPSVNFGLNDEANDVLFNLLYNRRF